VKQPPRLVARALLASFLTVALILTAVFVLISLDVRRRVRQSVVDNLENGQQVYVVVERRRQQDSVATVSTLAENPTLKAALDTWQTERRAGGQDTAQLVDTVANEANKIAARVGADVLAFLDVDGHIVASAGPRASAWAPGTVLRSRAAGAPEGEFVAVLPAGVFRVTGVPLLLGEALIGSLELGTALDASYAQELATLARGHSAILIDNRVHVTTLPADAAAALAVTSATGKPTSGTVTLAGESYALRHVNDVHRATFLTLASVDDAAAAATRSALTGVGWIGLAAIALAGVGSFWLARALTRPIDQLSASVSAMTIARKFDTPVPATGTSRELDALAGTFNALIRAVADAEAQTQAAYLGAIRALAAALDARDPYTAGHSERVSALSVEIGRAMALSDQDLGILRLGALLHDIGKIGVPDEVLGKTSALTAAEFELIRAHPVIGARILRSIPFLAPHLPIVELHHERLDGLGYPYGLIGDAIPLAARIVHVADAYDAITSARAYRNARPPHEAIAELNRGAGDNFDPDAVRALVHALPRMPSVAATFDPSAFQFVRATLCAVLVLWGAAPAIAQTGRVALDVVVAVDGVKGSTPRRTSGVWFDVFGAVRIIEGLDFVARPVVARRTFDGVWQKQLYQLGLRYERGAADDGIGLRLEAGQLPSPIGIAMLENRSDLNPLVSQHSAYYLPLPRGDPEIPRVFLIAGAYPLGAQATVASRKWDARVAILDSSPVRGRSFFGANKPPRLLNAVAGLGVTPRVGLRVGVAMAHGAYVSADELINRSTGDRDATMVQAEGEWSFGHTRIVGELVRSAMETARADAVAAGGWVQVTQTLAPRVFVAGRADTQHFVFEAPGATGVVRHDYERYEAILGFRVTPDLTLRGGYLVRKGYVVTHWDDQVLASIVWQRKIY
jgi:putative nucleotidyltransferase with HDIG domain